MSGTTTAEVHSMMNLTQGTIMLGFTVWTDREVGRHGLTKGRKVGTIVNRDLPGLLRSVAELCEQNGGTFEGLVEVMDKK